MAKRSYSILTRLRKRISLAPKPGKKKIYRQRLAAVRAAHASANLARKKVA